MFLILKGEFDMWKSISMFLGGALTALLIYLKLKNPEVVNVQGDQINDPKIKDNRKDKSRNKLSRLEKRKERRLRKERKRELRNLLRNK